MKRKTYEDFVEKFKPKLTTDDCYTPPLIYDTVRDWACREYGIDPGNIVRPFWPGGDYEHFDYPDGCTVLDNPPFSILSKICEWYLDRNIKFFLFAPSLTALSGKNVCMRMNHIICDADIVYENGAIVRTAFVTSFGGDTVMQSAPDLHERIKAAVAKIRREKVRTLTRYEYPDSVVTAEMVQKYAYYGVEFEVRRQDCVFVRALDAQATNGKSIFGGGLLLSSSKSAEKAVAEKAVAEKAVAEKAAAVRWPLSAREQTLIAQIDAGTLPQPEDEQLRMW